MRPTAAVVLVGLICMAPLGLLLAAELPTASTIASERKADKVVPLLPGQSVPRRELSRFTWPGLGQDKTIALGEALKRAGFKREVVIWCATVDCTDLAADLDDAFQIADIKSDLDRREVESSSDRGIFVGPQNSDAQTLAQLITMATGLVVAIVDAPQDKPLALIIGKRPR